MQSLSLAAFAAVVIAAAAAQVLAGDQRGNLSIYCVESARCLLTLSVCNQPLVAITSCSISRINTTTSSSSSGSSATASKDTTGSGSGAGAGGGIANISGSKGNSGDTSSSSSGSGSSSHEQLYALVNSQGVALWEIQRGLGHVYVAGGHSKAVVALHTGSLADLVRGLRGQGHTGKGLGGSKIAG
jgi:hypothetical protein